MSSAPRLRYEPGLDGLRALAVVAVLAFHDGRLAGGFLGVSTFFTLSGFLITSLLLAEHRHDGRISLRRFYARRARRLLPAAWLGLALAAAVTIALHDATTSRTFTGDALAALANVANWRFVWSGQSYAQLFATPSPVLHFWSLAIEEQLYLVLAPLLVVLLRATRGRRGALAAALATLAAASFADGWVVALHAGDRAYYGTDTRALEFLVGALVATLLAGRAPPHRARRAVAIAGPVALAGLVVATFRAHVGDLALFRGGLLAYALGGIVVVLAAREKGPVRWLCSLAPLRALGRISYGVYVFHWPIFLWLNGERTGLSAGPLTGLRLVVTLAVASSVFAVVERPVRTGARVVGRARWIAVPGALAGVTAAAITVAAAAPAPVVRFAPTTSPASMLAAMRAATSTTPIPVTGPVTVAATRAARRTTTTAAPPPVQRVLVVGDSVALTLGRGVERWGKHHGVWVWNGGALGCTLLDDALVRGYWGVKHRSADECHTESNVPRVLDAFRPDVVVVLYGAWDVYDASFDWGHTWFSPGEPAWDSHYAASVTRMARLLGSRGARVVWVAPPCFAPQPGNTDVGAPWYDPARVAAIAAVDRRVAATVPGMHVTDVVHRLGCPVDLPDRPDGAHYSDPGADRAAARLGPVLLAR